MPHRLKLFLVKIDKNIKWRNDNQAAIVEYINNRNGDGNNAPLAVLSTTMLAAALMLN